MIITPIIIVIVIIMNTIGNIIHVTALRVSYEVCVLCLYMFVYVCVPLYLHVYLYEHFIMEKYIHMSALFCVIIVSSLSLYLLLFVIIL
jgi:hypothetical protein